MVYRYSSSSHHEHLEYHGDGSKEDIKDFQLQARNQTFEKAVNHHLRYSSDLEISNNTGKAKCSYLKIEEKIFEEMSARGWRFNAERTQVLYNSIREYAEWLKEDRLLNRELAYYMWLIGRG